MGFKTKTASKAALGTYQVSVCKVCHSGVYSNQPWTWATRPLGISHDNCLTRTAVTR